MRKAIIFILCLMSGNVLCAGTDARILLDSGVHEPIIQGEFEVLCLRSKGRPSLHPVACQAVDPANLKAKAVFKSSQFRIVLSGADQLSLKLMSGRSFFKLRGRAFRFRGKFRWQGQTIKQLDVVLQPKGTHWVLHLPLERYLEGVLGAEVPGSWPIEALKAQAVASRSYFLWKQDLKGRYYDVRSDHMDQVFSLRKKVSPNIRTAVRATRGVFLRSNLSQKVFPAFFHSDCGGGTSTEHSVWRRPASENQPVVDRFCRTAPQNRWTHTLASAQILSVLKKIFLLPRGVKLMGVMPSGRKGDRAFFIDFLLGDHLVKSLSANEFRKQFGFGKIKSTRFQVVKSNSEFKFTGQGYGHGVGMCQWGAKRWASKGRLFPEILRHYYPTAELRILRKSPYSVASRARRP